MEHSIDLSACHFIQDVAPSSTSKLVKKIKEVFKDADVEGDIDLDALDSHFSKFGFGEDDTVANDEDDNGLGGAFDQFDIADSIGKALALVKQVLVDQCLELG
jgi:hypothetical protein